MNADAPPLEPESVVRAARGVRRKPNAGVSALDAAARFR